jgi:aminoglycoside phosphotransferase
MLFNIKDWQQHLPAELKDLLGDAIWQADDLGCSGTHIYHIGPRYLKIAPSFIIPHQEHRLLEAEEQRLQWLCGRLPVPEVHYYAHNGQFEFLLTSEIAGTVSCDRSFQDNVPEVVRLLAQGLQMIHRVDMTDCPFDQRSAPQLEIARRYSADHIIDKTLFNIEFQGMDVQEVYELTLKLCPREEDLVFTHGDYCLPNILLNQVLRKVNGFIDWGRGGVADRYADLALAARSLTLNFGAQWVPLLFQEYGLTTPDHDKLRFYRALDEITFYPLPNRGY